MMVEVLFGRWAGRRKLGGECGRETDASHDAIAIVMNA